MSDVNPRRIALGDQLRLLRESADMSGKRLAERLNWQASKISRIENARQHVTDSDIVAWCTALRVPKAEIAELRDELRAIRVEEARWSQQLRVGHRAVQESVAKNDEAATRIRVFSIALVPGLLQTAEYARHVFLSLAELHNSPRDTEEAVRARMQRQESLYAPDKQIELLMTESALRHPIAPASVMHAQVDRLIALQGMPTLRLGIMPFGRPLPAAATHNFVIRDDNVTIELINTEVSSSDPEDVQLFERYLQQLWERAAEGDAAREILLAVSADYAQQRNTSDN
ncbi:MAG: helix-turn-helix domain-containing protein [Pseudonocardiaceae bacterium]|nr:helix-turn-helix domain-containing protein [Pseudonocardiaceae bacterium]